MIEIVAASVKDTEKLSALEMRSQAYWGYSHEFMDKFKEHYLVTEGFIASNPTYILHNDDGLIGFYGLSITGAEPALEYLFIEPEYIGQGFGRKLWNHALAECENRHIRAFTIITSPYAREFYLHLGAVVYETINSLITNGRKIPKLIYRL
jgi:GNAT superfamily N-acetyltransferase